MQKPHWQALAMIAGVALTWPAQAQTIYRCGNAYSQLPCPGAVPLELNDARLPEQKLQTDAAAITDARLANAMAQQRLAEEQRQLANNQPVPQGAASAPAKPLAKAVGTKKQKQKKPKVKKRASPAQK